MAGPSHGYIVTIDCCFFTTPHFHKPNDIDMIKIGMPYAFKNMRTLQLISNTIKPWKGIRILGKTMDNELNRNGYPRAYGINFFKELVGCEGLMMKSFIFSALFLFVCSDPAFASQGAYGKGKTSRTEIPLPIITCDADDKYNPGFMYDRGQGGLQSREEIVKWYQKAADHGNAMAQYRLGSMYLTGEGVPQDYIQAHLWFSLSAARGISDAAICRDNVAKKMTPQQIAKAHELVQGWEPKPWFELKEEEKVQQKKMPEEKSRQ